MTQTIYQMGFLGFTSAVLTLAVVALLIWVMLQRRRVFNRAIQLMALGVFLVGAAFYLVGYLSLNLGQGDLFLTLSGLLRALFSAAAMFAFQDNVAVLERGLSPWFTNNTALQLLFWMTHLLAAVVTASALLSVFGRQFLERISLHFRRFPKRYYLFGNAQEVITLGRNIALHDNARIRPDRKRLLVCMAPVFTEEQVDAVRAFEGIVIESNLPDLEERLESASAFYRVSKREQRHIILLVDDDSAALAAAKQLAVRLEKLDEPHYVELSVRSHNEWMMQELDNLSARTSFALNSIALHTMAVRKLLLEHPPFKFLHFEKAVANRGLHALVVGFGQVGQAATLALVESAPFLGGLPQIDIVDTQAVDKQERFYIDYPAFRPGAVVEPFASCEFYELDVTSSIFWQSLQSNEPLAKHYDYVIVALGHDNLNLDVAYRIVRLLQQETSREADNGDAGGADACSKDPCLTSLIAVQLSKSSMLSLASKDNLVAFGQLDSLLNDACIINANVDTLAKAVNLVHAQSLASSDGLSTSSLCSTKLWAQLSGFLRSSNRSVADFIPAYLHLAGTTCKEVLSEEGATLTKDKDLLENLVRTEHRRWAAFHYSKGYLPMSTQHMSARAAILKRADKNLASCHKDEELRSHACLVAYEDLSSVNVCYAKLTGDTKRDFYTNNLSNIIMIPKFLRLLGSENKG
ncbi:MAG: hypothetical protein FWD27_00460 [Coriobacteriia bacterium]|nr:hypothetical protein [Coriobacteriia bacterium]